MSLNVGSLPDDLVHRILLWLPVMSLLRFKTVCKSWYALIQSSSFTHQHYLHHQQHEEENYTLVMNDPHSAIPSTPPRPKLSVLSPHDTTNFQPQLVFDVLDDDAYLSCTCNISICNGIICLQVLDMFLYPHEKLKACLWNPTIKQHYLLPPSPFPPTLFPNEARPYVVSIGFGLDSKTQDYKVIRIFDYPYRLPRLPNHIEIYSLHSDSWRTLDTVCFPVDSVYTCRRTSSYRSGTYCWMGRNILNDHSCETVILSFDFAREVFETMALPDIYCVKSAFVPLLSIIRDQIAIVNKIFNQNLDNPARWEDQYFEIWVLKEYGFRESWTKLYKIGPFDNPMQVGLSPIGDFILFTTGKQLFIDYMGTGRRSTLPTQDNLLSLRQLEIATYRESLVCIRPGMSAANGA